MLARREVVTLRALVDSVGTSTMAVYTHFGGMPGLWRAVRQEGFTRLVRPRWRGSTAPVDPVRDLMALGAAYASNALTNPYLYRAMFDTAADLENPAAADAGFQVLVAGAERARQAGRFARLLRSAGGRDPTVGSRPRAAHAGAHRSAAAASPRTAGHRHRLRTVRRRR